MAGVDWEVTTPMPPILDFDRLVATERPHVYHVALGILADEDDAEDVTQEVVVRALACRKQYQGTAKVSTWIYPIALRLSLNRLRQRQRQESGVAFSLDEVALGATTGEGEGDEAVFQGRHASPDTLADPETGVAERDALASAIAGLPDVFRATMVLTALYQFTAQETADALGVPVGTVKSRTYAARRLLAEGREG